MRKLLLLLVFVAFAGYVTAQEADSVEVTFNVDMQTFADTSADFDPTTDTVYITGEVLPNDWVTPGDTIIAMMVDSAGDGTSDVKDSVYTCTLKMAKNDTALAYKYFYVPEGAGSSWDYGEWEGGDDRMLHLNSYADSKIRNDMWGIRNVNVTINVDMNYFADTSSTLDLTNDTVYLSGNLLGAEWSEPGTNLNAMMTDMDDDSIYTWSSKLIPNSTYEYKFFYVPAAETSSWDNGEWQGGDNRVAEIAGADTTLNKYWNAFMAMFNVTDGTDPVEGASIDIADMSLTTDAEGKASQPFPNGDHDYTVTADNFEDATGTLTIDYGPDTLNIELTAVDDGDDTGIDDLSEIANVKVYPNPSNGHVTISGNKIKGGTVEVINTIGARVKKIQLSSDKQHLNLEELKSGVYFIQIEKDNKRGTQKLIIE